MKRDLKVLIIPLDWGLGHATRCIPLIQHMLNLGWKVSLAGEGKTAKLLSMEFPELPTLHIKGYRISYPKKGWLFIPKIILQIPKIIAAIIHEHFWLKQKMKKHAWDLIISDNRYGLFTCKARTIIITHQLNLISGLGKPIDLLIREITYLFLQRYNTCWVPDTEDDMNISGILSHPNKLPKNVEYIGPISRMEKNNAAEKNIILLLLSGPEPQRTILEDILVAQANEIDETFICIRGLPTDEPLKTNTKNIQFINHVGANDLSAYIHESKMVVCRTGYSTVMDLIKLQKKALMIPTPGQTEQEYLGKRLKQLDWFMIQDQQHLDLQDGIKKCQLSTNMIPALKFDMFSKAIEAFSIQYFGA
jgi:uncharacterized protein (TIGR00661 family)